MTLGLSCEASFSAVPFVGAQDGPWPALDRERPPRPLCTCWTWRELAGLTASGLGFTF